MNVRQLVTRASAASTVEVARKAVQTIIPDLTVSNRKGQAGKIAVVGGCREYTGAPYFAGMTVLRMGADLSHIFCSRDAGPVIKSYSPELMVHPVLRESYDAEFDAGDHDERKEMMEKVVEDVNRWLPGFDCLVVGPGLGRDAFMMDCVAEIMRLARQRNIPLVVDGDGLFLVTNRLELVEGYPLAVLTPNANEYKRLTAQVLKAEALDAVKEGPAAAEQLKALASSMGGVTVVQKGVADRMSDGSEFLEFDLWSSPRRCGGQGDVLAGSIATLLAWARAHAGRGAQEGNAGPLEQLTRNPALLAGYGGSLLLRHAANRAYLAQRRSMVTSDVITQLGKSFEELFPSGDWPAPQMA